MFIAYASPLGFDLEVPAGWARTDRADGVVFADKYGKIEVTVAAGDLPTPKTAADALKASLRAVDVKVWSRPREAGRPGGLCRLLTPTPSPLPSLTNRFRLENDRYLFTKSGKIASVTFSAWAGLTMRTSGS